MFWLKKCCCEDPEAECTANCQNLGAVQDRFTDDDDTPVQDHTPNIQIFGDTWHVDSGTWSIQSNRLLAESDGITRIYTEDRSDGELRVDMYRGDSDEWRMGVIFRYIDDENYWCAVALSGGGVRLIQVVGGTETELASDTLDVGSRITVYVECRENFGTEITVDFESNVSAGVTLAHIEYDAGIDALRTGYKIGVISDQGEHERGNRFDCFCASGGCNWRDYEFCPDAESADDFTDPNGTELGDHCMNIGDGWRLHTSAWRIQGNVAECIEGGISKASTFCATVDHRITCTARTGITSAANSIGIIARGSGPLLTSEVYVWLRGDADEFAIYTFDIDGNIRREFVSFTVENDTVYEFDIEIVGDTITATCNGVTIDYTGGSEMDGGGFAGLRSGLSGTVTAGNRFENWCLTPL